MDTETSIPPSAPSSTVAGTLAEIREFFGRTEAPWRVTIVIIATFIGVLIVAWDTARRTKPSSSAPASTSAAPPSAPVWPAPPLKSPAP